MGLLDRDGSRQTARERGRLRRHMRELDELRDERLRDLGGLALEMYKRDRFEGKLLWSKAAEIAAIDDEAKLVRRGIDEGLSMEQLEDLAKDRTKEPGGATSRPAAE
jgi:hypothetical protein